MQCSQTACTGNAGWGSTSARVVVHMRRPSQPLQPQASGARHFTSTTDLHFSALRYVDILLSSLNFFFLEEESGQTTRLWDLPDFICHPRSGIHGDFVLERGPEAPRFRHRWGAADNCICGTSCRLCPSSPDLNQRARRMASWTEVRKVGAMHRTSIDWRTSAGVFPLSLSSLDVEVRPKRQKSPRTLFKGPRHSLHPGCS